MDSPQVTTDTAASPQPERQWVWRASLASRAAGKISVLACVETVFAVALYWWIAIRWDTHWHLVSSLFIAPLLLLRSPESIAAGVRWFMSDWFGFESYRQWPKAKQRAWLIFVVMACFFFARWLAIELSLETKASWSLFFSAGSVSLATIAFAFAGLGALESGGKLKGETEGDEDVSFAGFVAVAVAVAVSVASGGLVAIVVAVAGMVAGAVGFQCVFIVLFLIVGAKASVLLVPSIASAFTLRASVFRVAATLRFAPFGLLRLPANWWENHLLTDVFIPAELLPGIRDEEKEFTLDGLFSSFWTEDAGFRILKVFCAPFLFLPSFLYRVNIKATAWFWWPLAFLLRPVKQPTVAEDQKEALCWPWTNPFQKLVFVGISLLALVVLFVRHVDPARWGRLSQVEGVWTPVKALLALNWSHIPPWHWAILISAVCSVVMLALAGGAVSCSVNKKWPPSGLDWKVKAMESLVRIRSLATVALLLFSLGALFIAHTPWHAHVPLPESWYGAMKDFYHVAPSPEVAPTPLTPK